jgi:hypothetical protein
MKINGAVASSSARKSRQGDELQAILGYLLDFEGLRGAVCRRTRTTAFPANRAELVNVWGIA